MGKGPRLLLRHGKAELLEFGVADLAAGRYSEVGNKVKKLKGADAKPRGDILPCFPACDEQLFPLKTFH